MIQQNKKLRWAILGTSVIGLSYLGYKFYHNYMNQICDPLKQPLRKITQQQYEPRLRTNQSAYSQFYFDKQQQLKIVISKIGHKGPTIEDIYLLSPMILVDQYLRYTKQIRKRRRLIRKVNQEKYIGLIRNYQFQVRELLQRGREEVLEEFGRGVDDLERMESQFQMFDNLQELKKKAFQELVGYAFKEGKLRRIPRQKLRRIMEEQISFVTNKMHQRIKGKLQGEEIDATPEEIYRVIVTLIDDIVYQKYGYQRQQIQKQLDQLPNLAKDLQKCRNTLFAEIGQFNMQSLESPDVSQGDDDNKLTGSAKTQILDGGSRDQ